MDNTLVSAVKNNKVGEVEGFLAAGASPDECDYDGWPVLARACDNCYKSIVELLLRKGSNVNKATRYGWTPLMRAAYRGDDSIIDMVLSANADVNLTSEDGRTALHCAAINNHSKVVSILLKNGCDMGIKDNRGETAQQLAERLNKKDATDAIKSFSIIQPLASSSIPPFGSRLCSSGKATSVHLSTAANEGTTTPVRQSPKQDSGKGDEQLVKQLMQRIEQLTQDGSAKDRQNRELKQRNADIDKSLRDEQLRRLHAVTQERREKEELQRRLRERDQQVVEVRQQNTELQRLLRNEQLQREDSVAKEKREKVELRQVLQRVLEDKHNLQKNLDEAQQHIQQLIEEKNNLQRLLIEKRREKSNIEELLADADAAIARYKQRQRNEVLNIPSHDIQLTNTELGRGSYGAVCVGYWRGCPVAVKSLYEDLAAVQRNVQLVQQEASVAWKIHHPNIATVCGVTLEVEGKRAWIIMELHSGSMSGVIDACQGDVAPLTLRETVDMTYDSLCGLDYIHSMQPREILHGDICPRNILVTPTMRAKLGDLGAARFQDVSLSVGLLSPQYTPPERFDVPTLPKNKATDMYSMGVTICELFTAAFPDREQRMDQVLLIRQIDVRSVCKHLMRENPVTRPTAAEARHVIGRIRETDEYKACPSKRMVKGKMDGIADVTLV